MVNTKNEFVNRMLEKADTISESMKDANFRFFDDPPEKIQKAFGGRQRFWEQGWLAVHRIGLLQGLGWRLPKWQHKNFINGVRIVARTKGYGISEQLYDIQFGWYTDGDPESNTDTPTFKLSLNVGPVAEDQLCEEYVRVMGNFD